MLSWRLWQTLVEPSTTNPIFEFVRDKRAKQQENQPRSKKFRIGVSFIVAMLLLIAFLTVPEFILLLFQIPILLIVIVIVSPLFLPFIFTVFGGILVNKIMQAIHQEKYQFTYELLCASPDGSLYANWSFAKGLLHRYEVFVWMKSVTQFCFNIGKFIVTFSGLIVVIAIIAQGAVNGLEQARLLFSLTIILGLYYSTMYQSIVVSFVISLYASNMDINRYDSRLIGMLGYGFVQVFPYLFALMLWYATTMINQPHPILSIALDALMLISIYLVRELMISILWIRLKYRLSATTDTTQTVQSESRPYVSIFSTG